MYQRTAFHSPNGQINANLTTDPTDYEAGNFPVEFQFCGVNRWDSRHLCGMIPVFIQKYKFM